MKLPPVEWKYFCRLATGTPQPGKKEEHLTWVHKTMGAIAQINQPDVTNKQLQSVMAIAGRCDQTDTRMWNATIHLINRYLEHSKQPDTDSDTMRLDRVMDALNGYLQTGIPWGPGDWPTLWGRSQRWHKQIQEETKRETDRQIQAAVWTSLVPTTNIGQYQFEPVETAQELITVSTRMSNCLRYYWHNCCREPTAYS